MIKCCDELKQVRENINAYSKRIFEHTSKIAEISEIDISMPRLSKSKHPNVYSLLNIFATLPLSSYSCERSASALRRLNTYLRCTQTEERLSAFALITMNYET